MKINKLDSTPLKCKCRTPNGTDDNYVYCSPCVEDKECHKHQLWYNVEIIWQDQTGSCYKLTFIQYEDLRYALDEAYDGKLIEIVHEKFINPKYIRNMSVIAEVRKD